MVAVYSLRRYCREPITVFLEDFPEKDRLVDDLEKFDVNYLSFDFQGHRYSTIKPFVLSLSPYKHTFALDSDLLFLSSVKPLWAPLSEKGVLVTRFHFPVYGMGGSAKRHGFASRVKHLDKTKHLVSESDYERTRYRLLEENIDINIGVLGHVKDKGAPFLSELLEIVDKNRSTELVDEMVTNILVSRHDHFLADEAWNCPSDDRVRRTSLKDAKILHYFADEFFIGGRFLGRNPATPEGQLWFQTLNEMNEEHDLGHWLIYDTINENLPMRLLRATLRRLNIKLK